jgi:hypothetical protein
MVVLAFICSILRPDKPESDFGFRFFLPRPPAAQPLKPGDEQGISGTLPEKDPRGRKPKDDSYMQPAR